MRTCVGATLPAIRRNTRYSKKGKQALILRFIFLFNFKATKNYEKVLRLIPKIQVTPHVNTARLQLLVSSRSLGIPNRKLLWLCLTKHSLRTWIGITELAAMDSMGSYQLSIGPVHTKLGRVSNAKGNWCEDLVVWNLTGVKHTIELLLLLFICLLVDLRVSLPLWRCVSTDARLPKGIDALHKSNPRGQHEEGENFELKNPKKFCHVLTAF